MCVCACVCVCMHVRVCVCACVCVHACLATFQSAAITASQQVLPTHMCTHTHTHTIHFAQIHTIQIILHLFLKSKCIESDVSPFSKISTGISKGQLITSASAGFCKFGAYFINILYMCKRDLKNIQNYPKHLTERNIIISH